MDYLDRLGELLEQDPPELIDQGQHVRALSQAKPAAAALAEAFRTVVTTGAQAVSADCGASLQDACQQLAIACSSDNNAVVTVIGELDDPERHTEMALTVDGDLIYLLGALPTKDEVDFKAERLLGDIMIAASRDGLLNAAHAVTGQGFLAALAQMAMMGDKGARFWTPDNVSIEDALFSSAPGRIICIVPRSEEIRFSDMCVARYVPLHRVGVVDGDVLEFQDHFTIPIASL